MARSVREIQEVLLAYGYDLGPDGADGFGGPKTIEAVGKFQLDSGLPVTGKVDAATYRLLFPDDFERKTKMKGILGGIFAGLLGNLLRWENIKGYLRDLLVGLGGTLVASGVIDQAEANTLVGAVLIVAGVVFNAISNSTKEKALDVVKAVDAAPGVTVVPATVTPTKKPEVVVTK